MARIRLVKRQRIYRGRIITLVREVYQAGGRRFAREIIRHPGAVVVVPMVDRSHLLFVRQYRRAVGRELLELPAGTLNRGESRLACARRELEEETGWRAHRLKRISQFYTAPGVLSEEMTVFLAEGLSPSAAHPEPDEIVTPVMLSLRAASRKVQTGAIRDAKSIIGVLLAQRLLAGKA